MGSRSGRVKISEALRRARHLIRVGLRQITYWGLRFAGNVLFLLIGDVAPLRGYEKTTKEYVARSGGRYIALDPEQVICYSARLSDHFLSPATYVATISQGRVAFDYGVTLTPHHTLLADVSPPLGGPPSGHTVLFDKRLSRSIRVSGVVAVVSSTAHQRYFHWMFDVLPRFDLLRRAGICPDKYVVNTELPFQHETLNLLGIDRDKLISPSRRTHIKADELLIPSLPGRIGFVTTRSCHFLRATFLQSQLTKQGSRLLYITRADSLTRRVANEAELINRLSQYPFEVIELDKKSVAEQGDLFADARMVVGPHGAGLTNLVFCREGTAVIEFMPNTYFNPCFEVLAGLRSLRYVCLPAQSVAPGSHDHLVEI